jgi:hypothetical protein
MKKQLTDEDVARIVNFIHLYEGGKVEWNTVMSVLPRLLDGARTFSRVALSGNGEIAQARKDKNNRLELAGTCTDAVPNKRDREAELRDMVTELKLQNDALHERVVQLAFNALKFGMSEVDLNQTLPPPARLKRDDSDKRRREITEGHQRRVDARKANHKKMDEAKEAKRKMSNAGASAPRRNSNRQHEAQ